MLHSCNPLSLYNLGRGVEREREKRGRRKEEGGKREEEGERVTFSGF
jgi:hypothetical protein